jgi:L-iditol 2-dehydrogenase
MKAALFYGPHDLRMETLPVPEPGAGQVLVRVNSAGLCMTDVHIYHGLFQVRPPVVLGHEFSGVVEAIGPEVTRVALGEAIGVEPMTYCGACYFCRRGHQEQCLNFRCLGNTEHGGFAEYALIQETMAYKLGGLGFDEAAWLEPLACILFALKNHPIRPAQSVLILGGGSIGNLFAQTALAFGATDVTLLDPNRSRIDLARSVGAHHAYQVSRSGDDGVDQQLRELVPFGFDYLVDTTGRPQVLERALGWAGRRSTLLLFGVADPAARLQVSPAVIFGQEITLTGSSGNVNDFAQALTLLQSGRIQTQPLVWKHIGLDDLPAAVNLLSQPGEKGKVMVHP